MTGESVRRGIVKSDRKEKLQESSPKASNGFRQYLVTGSLSGTALFATLLFVLSGELQSVEAARLPPPPQLIRPVNISSDINFLYDGKMLGPESFVIDGDHIYTGSPDGWVKDYHKGQIRNIAKFGKESCDFTTPGASCGRPLGIRLEREGSLLVCDADLGIFRVNITTGEYEEVYDSKTPVNGNPSLFLNDLDIGLDGSIYFTDTSLRWPRSQLINALLEEPGTGRLLKYSPMTNETEELMGGIYFANGVQMTHDYSAVLVAEFGAARIIKYDLKTKKSSMWVDNLPGLPDNIRYSKETGTYWIGLGVLRRAGQFSVFDSIRNQDWFRAILQQLVGCQGLQRLFVQTSQVSLAVEVDKSGNIIRSLLDEAGRIGGISEVHASNCVVYFGSPSAPHMGKLTYGQGLSD